MEVGQEGGEKERERREGRKVVLGQGQGGVGGEGGRGEGEVLLSPTESSWP